MKDNSIRLGFVFTIFVLFIGVSISPSIIGNVEKNTNPSTNNFLINSYTENLGLLAYWSFDEGSGDIAHDYSGHGYHGTINGASWTTGYSGYALNFDGEANYVNLDTYSKDLGFNKTDDYIISAWIKSDSTHSGVIYMISSSSPDLIFTPIFYIKLNFDGTLQMKIQSTPYCELIINSTNSYNDGLWHYIKGIYHGNTTNPLIELYVDSELVGHDSNWLCFMSPFQFKKAKIGMASYENIEFFNGIIDEVKVIKIPGGNKPPNAPTITGKVDGKTNKEYEYKFMSTDLEGNNITYCIDWGDNTSEVCIGPYPSGVETSASHIWSEKGDYIIKAKAMDVYGYESDWTTLAVSMPHQKQYINQFIQQLIEKLIYRFPFFEKILNHNNN